jgi:hypothetical protein
MCIYQHKTPCTTTRTDSWYHEHYYINYKQTNKQTKERKKERRKKEKKYSNVSNQQDVTTFSFINLFKSALHVSGDKLAHPQEHFLTVYTAFGTMN